ncbi:hypothetical protein F5Y18DRAFT_424917 [Xylariaceae sp. FL1019]|nr:hypothetical protein F5Y18DRAFT_424917 [Xylariaceae sp. FL1019]
MAAPLEEKPLPQTSPRKLFKGNLRPPCIPTERKSYTLNPAPIGDPVIKDPAVTRPPPIAIHSAAVCQPFVDPASLHRRPPCR